MQWQSIVPYVHDCSHMRRFQVIPTYREIAESGLYGWEVANGHAACLAWSSNRTSGEHVSVNNTTIGGRMEIRVQKLLRMNLSFYTGTQNPLWRCPNISKNTQNQVVWTKNMFCKWTYIYHIYHNMPSGKHTENYGTSPCLVGTVNQRTKWAMFNSKLLVYQRVS